MSLIYMFMLSFGLALVVGFGSVIFQHSSEKAYESELVKKIGQWIFLLPIITYLESKSDNIFSRMEAFRKNQSIERALESTLKSIASICLFIVIFGSASYLLFWFIAIVFTNYFFEVLLALAAIIAVVKFAGANK